MLQELSLQNFVRQQYLLHRQGVEALRKELTYTASNQKNSGT